MRDIKLRAWREKSKIMSPALALLEWIELGSRNGEFVNSHEVKWMQYTGLKDKNGVEIYEGDVIRDRHGNSLKVKFLNGMFGFHYPLSSQFIYLFKLMPAISVDVIGNIYENPELISD